MNYALGFYRMVAFPQQLNPFQRIFRGIRGGDSRRSHSRDDLSPSRQS